MKYREDPRICVWDLFNEVGNSNRETISIPHVQRIFDTARACSPMQPLTSGLWEGLWRLEENGKAGDFDFTKWQHDLFRPSHRPYDPGKIRIIRHFCELADRDFAAKKR